jgi:hypothetical protein
MVLCVFGQGAGGLWLAVVGWERTVSSINIVVCPRFFALIACANQLSYRRRPALGVVLGAWQLGWRWRRKIICNCRCVFAWCCAF